MAIFGWLVLCVIIVVLIGITCIALYISTKVNDAFPWSCLMAFLGIAILVYIAVYTKPFYIIFE